MYSQLQSRYPRASLVSELLQFQNGSYVVRAVVQVGEVTITSGMAASPSIEEAEDQARLRALAVLGIYPLGHLQAPLIVQADAPSHEQKPLLNQPAQLSLDQSTPAPRNPASTEPPASLLSGGYPDPEEDVQEGLKSLEVISPTRGESKFSDPQSRNRRNDKANQGLKPDQNGRQHLKTALQAEARPAPVDLSDTIAQTSVELKRLGWSDVQGRNYLQQTYGKRSRSSLTDEELLEFLQHLQAQPPTDEPF